MKQQFAIVAALVNNPELLILDEPKNGLDPEGINHIRALIIKITKSGTTLILTPHMLDEVKKSVIK
jgi:ABC-2 type transport system ATP-binding protein